MFLKSFVLFSQHWRRKADKDLYVRMAQEGGLMSRAFFKLQHIVQKFPGLFPLRKAVIVELGCNPGGWSQFVVGHFKTADFLLLALDKTPASPYFAGLADPRVRFHQIDATVTQDVVKLLPSPQCLDVVLSDMAPPATGQPARDHIILMSLAELALNFAAAHLKPAGHLVVKVSQGTDLELVVRNATQLFDEVVLDKPPSSRDESREIFMICKRLKKKT